MKSLPMLLLTLLIAVASGCSSGTQYPDRPITLICPWAVGGGTDRVSRQVAAFLERDLGVPVNVVNATGGQGVTGHARGLQARPDGYTLTMMTLELNMLHWRHLTKLTWQDSAALMSVNEDPAALFVRNDSPLKSIHELEVAAKAESGRLKASGTSSLAAWHLALAGWLISRDLAPEAIKWVPSQGSAPALQELMSGGLDLVCCSLPEARSLLESGDLRCLGVMAAERMSIPDFAKYPTLKEQGCDWTLTGWRAIGVPRDTPPEIQERLRTALRRMVTGEIKIGDEQSAETFAAFMERQGFDHTFREGSELAKFLGDADAEFGTILRRPEFQTVSSGPVSPSVFPWLATILLTGSLGMTLFESRRRLFGDMASVDATPVVSSSLINDARLNFVIVIAAIVLYVLLSEWLGFLLTAALVLLLLARRLGTDWKASLLLAVLVPPAFYQLFAGLLRVALPVGLLGW